MYRPRPSASHRWTNCFASPRLSDGFREEAPGDAAREGTCAAWVAETALRGEVDTVEEMADRTHENGWLVTQEMVHHCKSYVEKVRSLGGQQFYEHYVEFNEWVGGTMDTGIVSLDGNHLTIVDLKYGYKIVEPYRNTQLGIYATGVAVDNDVQSVTLAIYQPRAWHTAGVYRTWELSHAELLAFADEIDNASRQCQDPNATALAGSWCAYCPAAGSCETLAHQIYSNVDIIEGVARGQMNASQLSNELDFLATTADLIDSRKKAVTAEAVARASNGEFIPGWSIDRPLGDRTWKVDPPVIEAITGRRAVEEKPMTPAKMERAGVPTEVVNALSSRPNRPPKLKRVSGNHYNQMFKFGDSK